MRSGALVLATMVACSSSGTMMGVPTSVEGGDADAGEPDDVTSGDAGRGDAKQSVDGARDGAKDGAKDVAEADANMGSATSCGAAGHDCLGAVCNSGICEPEPLRAVSRAHALAVDATDLYVVDAQGPTTVLQRGAKTPGGTTTVVSGPVLRNFDNLDMRVAGGYLYFGLFKAGQGPLHRRPLSGGGATDEVVASDIRSFDVDDKRVTFADGEYPKATWVGAHASTPVEFPTSPSAVVRRQLQWLTLEGSSVFGLYNDDIYESSALGGPSAALVGAAGGSSTNHESLIATQAAFYGTRFGYSNPVTCASTAFSVWRKARVGSASTLLHTGNGWVPKLYADAKGALYTLRPCNGAETKLMAYRESDGATYVVAELADEDVFAADDTYVYFSRWLEDSIYRVAR